MRLLLTVATYPLRYAAWCARQPADSRSCRITYVTTGAERSEAA